MMRSESKIICYEQNIIQYTDDSFMGVERGEKVLRTNNTIYRDYKIKIYFIV